MGCGVYYQQLHNIEDDLDTLRRLGIDEEHDAYRALDTQRGELLTRIGQKFPRKVLSITHEDVLSRLQALGLEYAHGSPGFTAEELKNAKIRVWYDIEESWQAEARFKPDSKPIYRSISAEDAVALIKHEETPALIAHLFIEDEYIGE
ncbi:MAG: hypothetical protein KJ556_21895 [Gammaproteobacteria bacterium]|nr:hypothetical protein [Gammaproteobacteria bacterium]